jgi:hypothetical protein
VILTPALVVATEYPIMAATNLIENFQNLNIKDKTSETPPYATCLPFNPKPDSGISPSSFGQVDRYLFRLFDRYSDGYTDNKWVKSRDAVNTNFHFDKDVFATKDRSRAAEALRRHLQWNGRPEEEDNFVSWSSSLLVVLQYAHYRAHQFWGNNFAPMSLCIVDTTLLPPSVFMRDMDLLAAFSRHDKSSGYDRLPALQALRQKKHAQYSGYYYFGEYLSQGALRIENRCSMVSMADIIDAGLYTLREELQYPMTKKEAWANRVITLRNIFYDSSRLYLAEDFEVKYALRIGDLYGSTWKLPIALTFLALKPRRAWDDPMVKELRPLYINGRSLSTLS